MRRGFECVQWVVRDAVDSNRSTYLTSIRAMLESKSRLKGVRPQLEKAICLQDNYGLARRRAVKDEALKL